MLEDLIGQQHIKSSLIPVIRGCQRAGVPLPPLFFAGSHGAGKTHVARAVAKATGGVLHEINCASYTISKVLRLRK